MTKRKPENVVVHRIELQTKERELLEQYMYMQQGNRLIESITQLKLPELYGILNILELFGIIDTPVHTVADVNDIPSAIHAWVSSSKINPETGEKETVLLQDRIINALAPLFSIDAWLGRDPTYGTPAYGSPTKGYSASGMTEEEVRQANTTEALGEDYIGPTYPSD